MTALELPPRLEWTAEALVEAAGEYAEGVPEQDEPELGHHVVRILGKRRTDVTDDDVQVMQKVVDIVRSQRRDDLEPVPGDATWRHRLMRIGHDPLKPPKV